MAGRRFPSTFEQDTNQQGANLTITTKLAALNANEARVMRAVIDAAAGNGHDFTFGDEVFVEGMSRQQVGAYLSSLEKKDLIWCEADVHVNGESLNTSQICSGEGGTFSDEAVEWAAK
jgi:hypothetical protein